MSNTGRDFKDAIYEQIARIGEAEASPKRLELRDLLGQREKTVETPTPAAGLSAANAFQHPQACGPTGWARRR